MKICNNCGRENSDKARYCANCGKVLSGSSFGRNQFPYSEPPAMDRPPVPGGSPIPGEPPIMDRPPVPDESQETSKGEKILKVLLIALVTAALAIGIFVVVGSVFGSFRKKNNKVRKGSESTVEEATEQEETDDAATEETSSEATTEFSYIDQIDDAEEKKEEEEEAYEESDEELYADFIFPDSHKRYLEDSEVAVLSKDEIQTAINEICARVGYKFKKPKWQEYFGKYDWYEPVYDNEEDLPFNKYEKANRQLLIDYREKKQ